jgi:hypothetical protein
MYVRANLPRANLPRALIVQIGTQPCTPTQPCAPTQLHIPRRVGKQYNTVIAHGHFWKHFWKRTLDSTRKFVLLRAPFWRIRPNIERLEACTAASALMPLWSHTVGFHFRLARMRHRRRLAMQALPLPVRFEAGGCHGGKAHAFDQYPT